MNKLDKVYTDLLQDILDNGTTKMDRTGTGTISVFGRQIRHNMKDGFPLITTKKMPFKTIVTELLWFLRGDTNIKYLVDNNCNIWNGDAYKNYQNKASKEDFLKDGVLRYDDFINKIKTDDEFAKKWGELGPVYGKQWRDWNGKPEQVTNYGGGEINPYFCDCQERFEDGHSKVRKKNKGIDQIANLINDLKKNPDSRRLMVNAWNPAVLQDMVLPPCHYGFQVYTREIDIKDELNLIGKIVNYKGNEYKIKYIPPVGLPFIVIDTEKGDLIIKEDWLDSPIVMDKNIPTRAISLMWNQRSVDTFLGLPFNIASYGLLLEIIAKAVNMVPDELIGNLGDVHLYSNHIEQAKEQIGRDLTPDEWIGLMVEKHGMILEGGDDTLPKRTREPFPLPKLNINTEFWPTDGGSDIEGHIDALAVFNRFFDDNFCKCLLEDIQLVNYQAHQTIKAPLSN